MSKTKLWTLYNYYLNNINDTRREARLELDSIFTSDRSLDGDVWHETVECCGHWRELGVVSPNPLTHGLHTISNCNLSSNVDTP